MLDRYRPSGQCPVTFLAMMVPGMALAAVVGVVYELAMQYIPLIYLDVLATIGAVVALFVVGTGLVSLGRCRNAMAAGLLGALMGATAWAVSFIFAWWWTVRKAQTPVSFFEYLPIRADYGFTIGKSGGGIPVKGIFAWALWVVEGGIFVLGTMLPTYRSAFRPFCEGCQKWAKLEKFSFVVNRPGEATVETLTKAQELPDLVPDPSKKEDAGPEGTRLVYQVKGCPSCTSVDHLNVEFKYTVIENKKPAEKTTKLHESVLIGQEELEAIRAYAGGPAPTAAQA